MLAFFLDSHTSGYDLDDKMQLTWDMAEAMNLELRQLVAAGCKVIQIEEPTLHFMACYYPNETKLLDFLVDCFNREVEGLEDAELWIHTCWGNPNMQKVFTDESYANSVEIYLDRLKGDVWTIEASENDLKELPLFGPHRDSLQKKIAVGVISHRTLQADFPEVVAGRVRRALEYIPADKLILSTDCGFGRQGFNRHLAFYKAAAIPQARNIVLKELGLEERYIAADGRAARLGSASRTTSRSPTSSRCGDVTADARTGKMPLSCGDHSFPVLPHEQTVELVKMLGFEAFDLAVMGNRSHIRPEVDPRGHRGLGRAARGADPRTRARDRRRLLHPVDGLRDDGAEQPGRRRARARHGDVPRHARADGAPRGPRTDDGAGDRLPRREPRRVARARRARSSAGARVEAHAPACASRSSRTSARSAARPPTSRGSSSSRPGLELTLDYTHYVSQGFAEAELEPLLAHARHFHARGGAAGRVQCALKDSTIDYGRAVEALLACGYDGALAVEYVWIDWERCNECDNVSETIILRDRLRAALAGERLGVSGVLDVTFPPGLSANRLAC